MLMVTDEQGIIISKMSYQNTSEERQHALCMLQICTMNTENFENSRHNGFVYVSVFLDIQLYSHISAIVHIAPTFGSRQHMRS